MIQRIQSVYLLGASILCELFASLLYVMPEIALGGYRIPFVIAFALLGLAGLGTVFLYKNRELQARVVRWLAFTSILFVIGFLVVFYAVGDLELVVATGALGSIIGLAVVPVVAVSLLFRTHKAIRRDIELIRSMDRLR